MVTLKQIEGYEHLARGGLTSADAEALNLTPEKMYEAFQVTLSKGKTWDEKTSPELSAVRAQTGFEKIAEGKDRELRGKYAEALKIDKVLNSGKVAAPVSKSR